MRSTRGLRDELVAHLAEQPFGPDAPESALRLWERLRDLAADGKLGGTSGTAISASENSPTARIPGGAA